MNEQANVHRVGYTKRCKCGLHGHIKYSQGGRSLEFFSYDEGVEILEEAVREKKILENNALILREEIASWSLFKDRILSFFRNIMNSLVVEGQPPEIIDKALDEIDQNIGMIYEEYFPNGEVICIDEESIEYHTLH